MFNELIVAVSALNMIPNNFIQKLYKRYIKRKLFKMITKYIYNVPVDYKFIYELCTICEYLDNDIFFNDESVRCTISKFNKYSYILDYYSGNPFFKINISLGKNCDDIRIVYYDESNRYDIECKSRINGRDPNGKCISKNIKQLSMKLASYIIYGNIKEA